MKILSVLFMCSVLAFAAQKPKEWNTGHVISFDLHHWISYGNPRINGQVDSDGSFTGQSHQRSHDHNTYYLALDAGEYVYYASKTLDWLWHNEPVVTENSDIKWRIQGKDLIILTETNKEFKMHLDKKRKK